MLVIYAILVSRFGNASIDTADELLSSSFAVRRQRRTIYDFVLLVCNCARRVDSETVDWVIFFVCVGFSCLRPQKGKKKLAQ